MHKLTSLKADTDIYSFKKGTHYDCWKFLGSHLCEIGGQKGVLFRVWAPRARAVSVVAKMGDVTSARQDKRTKNRYAYPQSQFATPYPAGQPGAGGLYHYPTDRPGHQPDVSRMARP